MSLDKQKAIKSLQMVADDMATDATEFDGRPFNGRTVAEYCGNQGAAIAAVANILKMLLEDLSPPAEPPQENKP